MHTLQIQGVATLTSPLHVASFDGNQRLQAYTGGKNDNLNAVPMMSQPIAVAAPTRAKAAGPKAQAEDLDAYMADSEANEADTAAAAKRYLRMIPVSPGNSLRGRWRKHCSDLILESLAARSQQISDRVYYSLRKGRASVSGDESAERLDAVIRAQQDIMAGVWGLETVVPSRIITPDWIPMLDPHTTAVIPEEYRHAALGGVDPYQLYFVYQIAVRDDLMHGRDALADQVWKGGREALTKFLHARADAMAEHSANKRASRAATPAAKKAASEKVTTKKVDFDNIVGFECIAPMTPFFAQATLRDVPSEEHLGFAIAGFVRVLEAQNLGGITRLGFGRYDAELDVTIDGKAIPGGLRVIGGTVQMAAAVEALVARGRKAVSGVTADTLASVHGALTKPKVAKPEKA